MAPLTENAGRPAGASPGMIEAAKLIGSAAQDGTVSTEERAAISAARGRFDKAAQNLIDVFLGGLPPAWMSGWGLETKYKGGVGFATVMSKTYNPNGNKYDSDFSESMALSVDFESMTINTEFGTYGVSATSKIQPDGTFELKDLAASNAGTMTGELLPNRQVRITGFDRTFPDGNFTVHEYKTGAGITTLTAAK